MTAAVAVGSVSQTLLRERAAVLLHDVLLPSVANAFRCLMRLQYLNHDPPTLLLLFFSGTVKDSHTSQDCLNEGGKTPRYHD